jgi:hypothetical protein
MIKDRIDHHSLGFGTCSSSGSGLGVADDGGLNGQNGHGDASGPGVGGGVNVVSVT